MWQYVKVPAGGEKGAEIAKDVFSVKDPGCPVVELDADDWHGGILFAVWCAAPLEVPASKYPPLHHVPKDAASKFPHIHRD